MDKLNTKNTSDFKISGITEQCFNKLNDELKSSVISANNESTSRKENSGILGNFLGANPQNAAIHITLIICLILLIFCGADLMHSFCPEQKLNSEMWNLIFPVITLGLGYVFGKGEDKK